MDFIFYLRQKPYQLRSRRETCMVDVRGRWKLIPVILQVDSFSRLLRKELVDASHPPELAIHILRQQNGKPLFVLNFLVTASISCNDGWRQRLDTYRFLCHPTVPEKPVASSTTPKLRESGCLWFLPHFSFLVSRLQAGIKSRLQLHYHLLRIIMSMSSTLIVVTIGSSRKQAWRLSSLIMILGTISTPFKQSDIVISCSPHGT